MSDLEGLTNQHVDAHADFVVRLARRLMRDPGDAADLAQQTWLATLERPPRRGEALRAWLAAVTRRLAWKKRRGEGRRLRREHRAARLEVVPSSVDVTERETHFRRLTEAVLRLPQPMRVVVYLRYYEDLTPSEISGQLNLPVRTVKSRLGHALAKLRSQLDDAAPGAWRSAFATLVAPVHLTAPSKAMATTAIGVFSMGLKTTVVAVVLVVAGLFVGVATLQDGGKPELGGPASEANVEGSNEPDSTPIPGGLATSRFAEEPDSKEDIPVSGDVVLRGVIIVELPGGTEKRDGDGKFTLVCGVPPARRRLAVRVVGGQWSARVPSSTQVGIRELTMSGRPASPLNEWESVPASRILTIRALEMQGVVLHVLDAFTRAPLDGVSVMRVRHWSPHYVFPSAGYRPENVVSGGVSPVRVPPGEYCVAAPGHAWKSMRIGGTAKTRTILLDAGGDLKVTCRGSGTNPHMRIRLYYPNPSNDKEYRGAAATPGEDGMVQFSSLVPRKYTVRAEIGGNITAARVLCEVEAQVSAGVATSVVLDIPRTDSSDRKVPLSGTLTVRDDPGGPMTVFITQVEGPGEEFINRKRLNRSDMTIDPARPDVLLWDAGLVRPMRHLITVEPFKVATLVDVPDSGDRAVRLVLPPLGVVRVTAKDAESQEPLFFDYVYWEPVAFPSVPHRSSPLRGSAAHPVVFRAPIGKIRVSWSDGAYQSGSTTLDVVPGENAVEVSADPKLGLLVKLREDGRDIPWPPGARLEVHDVVRDSRQKLWIHSTGTSGRVELQRPGTYRVIGIAGGDHRIIGTLPPVTVRRGAFEMVPIPVTAK